MGLFGRKSSNSVADSSEQSTPSEQAAVQPQAASAAAPRRSGGRVSLSAIAPERSPGGAKAQRWSRRIAAYRSGASAGFHKSKRATTVPRSDEAKTLIGYVVLKIPVEHTMDRPDGLNPFRDWVLRPITRAGLQVNMCRSANDKHIFCVIFATVKRLLLEASRTALKLEIDPDRLREADIRENKFLHSRGLKFCSLDGEEAQVDPENMQDVAEFDLQTFAIPPEPKAWYRPVVLHPYEYMHAPYESVSTSASLEDADRIKRADRLFRVSEHSCSILSSTNAVKMIFSIIRAPVDVAGGAGLNLEQLKVQGIVTTYFVAHDYVWRKKLKEAWTDWKSLPWQQPTSEIRSYFGEKIGMYFAFLGMYTLWLLFPGLLGALVFAHQLIEDKVAVSSVPIYGIAVCLWTTLFVEYWKREQSMQSLKWGMSDFRASEEPRPQYLQSIHVKKRKSFTDGKVVYWQSPAAYACKILGSYALITTFVGVVIALVFSIFLLRILLIDMEEDGDIRENWGGYTTSIVNALQIQIMNLFYEWLAEKLTDWENHRTDTKHENSLITKTCVFQFINSNVSLWYIAFLKNNFSSIADQDCDPDCLTELRVQLAIIFITRITAGNFVEFFIPWFKRVWRRHGWNTLWCSCCHRTTRQRAVEKHKAKIRAAKMEGHRIPGRLEKQSLLEPYRPRDDYLELMQSFGFVSMFVVSFPVLPLIALVSNYVEIRVDSIKLLKYSARPRPEGAQDIGTWLVFLGVLGYIAVITNLALVVFVDTSDFYGTEDAKERVIIFVLLEHVVLGIKYMVGLAISDVPHAVTLQLARQEYLVGKHLLGIKDGIFAFGAPDSAAASAAAVGLEKKGLSISRAAIVLDRSDIVNRKLSGFSAPAHKAPLRFVKRGVLDDASAAPDAKFDESESLSGAGAPSAGAGAPSAGAGAGAGAGGGGGGNIDGAMTATDAMVEVVGPNGQIEVVDPEALDGWMLKSHASDAAAAAASRLRRIHSDETMVRRSMLEARCSGFEIDGLSVAEDEASLASSHLSQDAIFGSHLGFTGNERSRRTARAEKQSHVPGAGAQLLPGAAPATGTASPNVELPATLPESEDEHESDDDLPSEASLIGFKHRESSNMTPRSKDDGAV